MIDVDFVFRREVESVRGLRTEVGPPNSYQTQST